MGSGLRLADRVLVTPVGTVHSRIARVILGDAGDDLPLGSITLHPHQRSAIERLLASIDRFNGALLCDDVGMGKTYVAISVARRFERRLVVTPAALVSMWKAALERTATDAELVTFETLSRFDVEDRRRERDLATPRERDPSLERKQFDLVIVDEAHHVRNPLTNRFFALESLVRGARVLLLSATPIHNHRDDLAALLSLFLGSRARALTASELALCVVRREHHQLDQSLPIPTVLPAVYHDVPDDSTVVEQLLDLPPPVPLRDGGEAKTLIGRGLLHLWASSEAAFREAVRKRIARAIALRASLEAGTYPTAKELESWAYGDGAIQLAFAELLSIPVSGEVEILAAVRTHLEALQKIHAGFSSRSLIDESRARIVAEVAASDSHRRTVAFAQYSETVSMLFRRLSRETRLAMLTSHGARVAGGALSRNEAVARFAPVATGSPVPPPAEKIDLLLTTDLLSEGVNLQDADTVIHLDIPWTVARMEQRVGRVARLGSAHRSVHVHVLRPPRSADEVLRGESIVQRKWHLAKEVVGTSVPNPGLEPAIVLQTSEGESSGRATPEQVEQLRAILERWIIPRDDHYSNPGVTVAATMRTVRSGFIAAISLHGAPRLLIGSKDRVVTDLASQIQTCARSNGGETTTDPDDVSRAIGMISKWADEENASAAAGLASSNAPRRRDLISRIDAAIASAPPHLRNARLAAAQTARAVVTTPQCAAVERELAALARSSLPDDEWVAAIANLQATAGRPRTISTDPLNIHAILILRDNSTL